MKKICVILIMLVSLFVFISCEKTEPSEKTTNESIQEKDSTIDVFGVVKCTNIESVIIDFPAVIDEYKISEGEKAKKGDVLVILNIQEYNKQIENKEIMLETEKLNLQSLEKDLTYKENLFNTNSDSEIQKCLQDIKFAEYNYNSYNSKLEYKKNLYNSNSISQEEYNSFLDLLESKKHSLEQSKLALEIVKNNKNEEIASLKESIEIKRNYITQIENEISIMLEKKNRTYLKDNTIVANINNCVIYNISYNKSDIVSPSQKVFNIMDLDSRIIESKVPEEFIKDVKVGANVKIKPLSDSSRIYQGKISKISDTAYLQNGETNVILEIAIEEDDFSLLPNFNVDLEIEIE